MSESAVDAAREPVRAERRGPAYWRVTFDNPPLNLYDPEVEGCLTRIGYQLEADAEVKVVVFDSALADRAIPDTELDNFVERFAQRIASFDTEALVAVKEILNEENPPPAAESLKVTNARFNWLLARDSV
ncbi:hypothetical protein [Nonomuraea roseola]|uniref:Enoyl-CoA hydratase/isomerase family protein n=1 Tax=Nonomuraea roseola TaxID=46179 RepID=A0ABV5QDG6_9ACTN